MKRLTCKLSTFLLVLCLLLSFAVPALAVNWVAPRPPRPQPQKDVDEQPFPQVSEKPRFFLFFNSANSWVVFPFFLKLKSSSVQDPVQKNSLSKLENGNIE
jgi:hypothetical protein